MGKLYPELDERLTKFIARQSVFFVATAPCLAADGDGGHVNLSPKGYRDTFAVLGPLQVAYLDLTGSGAETIAHLRQNGRITVMFCSFDRQPKILRLMAPAGSCFPAQPTGTIWQRISLPPGSVATSRAGARSSSSTWIASRTPADTRCP